jgi:hypothetical protein
MIYLSYLCTHDLGEGCKEGQSPLACNARPLIRAERVVIKGEMMEAKIKRDTIWLQ